MNELTNREFETLREDGEFVVSRAKGAAGSPPRLLITCAVDRPAPASLAQLERAHALRGELDPAWAARPLELGQHGGRPALLAHDPGGEFLDGRLGRPLAVAEFLRLAVGVAAALGRFHARGLVHRDLKPAHLLVDAATGRAWLTGFGLASRLPRGRPAPAPPEVLAGTLAYMAPEQTGRMNRSVDARSDLYALGVTFYEMLTGAPPFWAADPMGWVHCHLARPPAPPGARRPDLPGPLAALALKLLAKAPEERYQSAAGLEADLRRCRAEWEARGRIEPFALGARDASDRLLIPERLYGREGEVGRLLGAFGRVAAGGAPELVLVSGRAGVGKSSVVQELHRALGPARGLFASGKYDQYRRDIPYATLAQAFQGLVRRALAGSDAEVRRWRAALQEALGPNGRLLVNLVPELELVVGKQPPVADLPPQEAQSRFQAAFRRFLGVFARPEHPLVLFLDDLQWLDLATLELLKHLITEPEVRHVLFVGAYRENEVGPSHPLTRTLSEIREAGTPVQQIALTPLEPHDVACLVADTLRCDSRQAHSLAALVHAKTDGNPFFVNQFLTALVEEGLLAFNPGGETWAWDIDRIRAKDFTDNVVELMTAKLRRLPESTRAVLGQLACLGSVAETATATLAHGGSAAPMDAALWDAVRAGLVVRRQGAYAFLHDRVQEAAYALIPERDRAAVHLRIGRTLLLQRSAEEVEKTAFEIAGQFNRALAWVQPGPESEAIARLNLLAGKRAKAAAAYASAEAYLTIGETLLTEDRWERNYPLAFECALQRGECEFLTGKTAAAEERLASLSKRAVNLVDLAAVCRLRMALFTSTDRADRAVEIGLHYLRRIGIEWPLHPTVEVAAEYQRIWQKVGERSIESLIDLPAMNDAIWSAAMEVLAEAMTPASFIDTNLRDLIALRMGNICLDHGNNEAACIAYVHLGMVLGPRFGDYQAGFRFGQLAVDLVDGRGMGRFQARVYLCFGNLVLPWTQPLRAGEPFIRRAFQAAIRAGDLNYAAYCCNHLVTNLLSSGTPLGEVQRAAEDGLRFTREMRFGLVIKILETQLALVHSLRGHTREFGSLEDATFKEAAVEADLQADPRLALAACWYWIRKLQARFYASGDAEADEAAANAEGLLWTSRGFFESAECHFFGALAGAARHRSASETERRRLDEAFRAHHQRIDEWARHCPGNFAHGAALLRAELARLEARELDAERLYETAIRLAREHGFVQNEGLANELAARFHAARGFQTIADAYLRNARGCYARWGADGKVRQLEAMHPDLSDRQVPLTAATTIGTQVEHLDFATVIKTSHALSGEMVLGSLVEKLMRLAVEHAGAERGLLVLLRAGEPRIEAQAATSQDGIEVALQPAAATPAEFSETVLRYVMRTRAGVVLDDASADASYAEDAYVRRHRPRSILCVPIAQQAKLAGALYLENNLTAGAFTPNRVAVLELLAAQAAISLENARLYAELERENAERKRVEDQLRRSEGLLSEGQRISRTGSWAWSPETEKLVWSAEQRRMFGVALAVEELSFEHFTGAIHPEDRPLVAKTIHDAIHAQGSFDQEFRIRLPDGSITHVQGSGRPLFKPSGEVEAYLGVSKDITESRRAEAALRRQEADLRQAQAELAHVTRVTTMGELAASIAHEVNQPIAGVVLNATAGLRWLAGAKEESAHLAEAREALGRIVRDGKRAGEVIARIRALFRKSEIDKGPLDLNETIREVVVLTRNEMDKRRIALRLELAPDLPAVLGDRVQLQQVMLNLILNAIEAMGAVEGRPRELVVGTQMQDDSSVLVTVRDSGPGLDPAGLERAFAAFHTTKPGGLGMGLSISRSIVENHGGRLWAAANDGPGVTFQFTLSSPR